MKYEKCLTCEEMGKSCDGPNLLAMDIAEMGQWCNEYRKIHCPEKTYDKIAANNDISKSAVYAFLTGGHVDYHVSTVRAVAKEIAGSHWDDNPCGNISNSERAQYEEQIRRLEEDLKRREDKIESLKQELASSQKLSAVVEKVARQRRIALIVLAVLLGLCVLAIIVALVIDRTNSGVGFFWLESWFKPHSVKDGMNLIGKGI